MKVKGKIVLASHKNTEECTCTHSCVNVKTAEWVAATYSTAKDAYIIKPGAYTQTHVCTHTVPFLDTLLSRGRKN